jgi:hypothetical protein
VSESRLAQVAVSKASFITKVQLRTIVIRRAKKVCCGKNESLNLIIGQKRAAGREEKDFSSLEEAVKYQDDLCWE